MTVRSMTGFGSAELETEAYSYRVELKTLNSRFFDINVRLPRSLSSLEYKIIGLLKKYITRGKVDISFDISSVQKTEKLPELNEDALMYYVSLSESVKSKLDYEAQRPSVYQLMRMDGVLEGSKRPSNYSSLHEESILEATKKAAISLVEARISEGEKLEKALKEIISSVEASREQILAERDDVQKQLIEQTKKRISNIFNMLDPNQTAIASNIAEDRLATEIAILADKVDIEEELTRLGAHCTEFLKILSFGKEIGRKLDFLCQEMHREINTISNKMTHLDIAKISLDLKQQVEKVRQQIQNIE